MKFIPYIFLLLFACTEVGGPDVLLMSEKEGRTGDGLVFLDVTIKNKGDTPAYFVIVMARALENGEEIAYKEMEFGDLLPDAEKTDRLTFSNAGYITPDDFKIDISYLRENRGVNIY